MKSAHAFTRWEKWATEHPPTNYLSPLDHHDHTCSHRSSTNNHNYLPRILTLCLCKFSVEMHKQDGSWISNNAWCYVVAPGNTRLGDWLTFSFYRISGCPLDTATDSGWAGPQLVNPGRQNMKKHFSSEDNYCEDDDHEGNDGDNDAFLACLVTRVWCSHIWSSLLNLNHPPVARSGNFYHSYEWSPY